MSKTRRHVFHGMDYRIRFALQWLPQPDGTINLIRQEQIQVRSVFTLTYQEAIHQCEFCEAMNPGAHILYGEHLSVQYVICSACFAGLECTIKLLRVRPVDIPGHDASLLGLGAVGQVGPRLLIECLGVTSNKASDLMASARDRRFLKKVSHGRYVATPKGLKALIEWEKDRRAKQTPVREQQPVF